MLFHKVKKSEKMFVKSINMSIFASPKRKRIQICFGCLALLAQLDRASDYGSEG